MNIVKIKLGIVVVLIVVAGVLYWLMQPKYAATTIPLTIQGKTYHLLTAKNTSEWQNGLMNIRELKTADGMVFLFPDYQYRTFWEYFSC